MRGPGPRPAARRPTPRPPRPSCPPCPRPGRPRAERPEASTAGVPRPRVGEQCRPTPAPGTSRRSWPAAPRPRGAEPPRPRTGHSAPGALRPWTRCRDPPHPARRRPGDPGSPGGSVRARSGSWARSTFRPCQLDAPFGQVDTEAPEPRPDATLHRALGFLQHDCDLAIGVATEVGQFDGLAELVGQCVEGLFDLLDHGQVPHLVVDVVGGGGRLAGGPLLAPAPGHLRADEVHRLAVGAGQQERTQRPPLSVELLRPVPEVEEDLLGDLLGRWVAAYDPAGQGMDRAAVAAVDLGQGRLLPTPPTPP